MKDFSQTLRYIVISGLFIVPFITLMVFNQLFFPFITGKAFVFRILTEILFALWIILAVYDKSVRPRFSWILVLLAGFIVTLGLSNILALDSTKAFWSNFERMEGYVTIVHLFAYFLVLGTIFKTERIWTYFFHTWLGVGFFLILYGFAQNAGEFVKHMSGDRIDATLGNSTYLAGVGLFLIFFVLYFSVRNRNDIKPLLTTISIGSGLFIAHAFRLYDERVAQAQAQTQTSTGSLANVEVSFFAGPIHESLFSFVCLLVVVSVGLMVYRSKISDSVLVWIHTTGYTVLGILLVVMILLTRTRGAIIGLLGGLGLTVLLIALFARARPRVQRIMAGLSLVGLLLGGVLVTMVITNTMGTTQNVPVVREVHNVFQEVPGLGRVAEIELGGKTVRSRFMVWKMASRGFVEKPVLGWGQGNFHYVFNKHYDPRMYDQEPWFDRAHNIIFDWLIAGGLVGAFLYFATIVVTLGYVWYDPDRGIFQRVRNSEKRIMKSLNFFESGTPLADRFSATDSSIFTGLIVGYLFHNLFVFDNIVSYLLFFSILAFIYAKNTPEENTVILGSHSLSEQARVITASVVCIVCVASVYFVNVRPLYANMFLLEAVAHSGSVGFEQTVETFDKALAFNLFTNDEIRSNFNTFAESYIRSDAVSNEVKSILFERARLESEKQIEETPQAVRPYIHYGKLLAIAGDTEGAIEQYEIAHTLSPRRQDLLFQLGHLYASINENQKAFDVLEEAFFILPSNKEARLMYAYGALLIEDEEALENARTFEGTLTDEDMAMNDRIMNAYLGNEDWDRALELLNMRVDILKRDIELRPDNTRFLQRLAETYPILASVYAQAGNRLEAIRVLERGIEEIPQAEERYNEIIDSLRR